MRVQPRLESGRKPVPLRSPGGSASACGAVGWNANDRICSASVGSTSTDPLNISRSTRFRQRFLLQHTIPLPIGLATPCAYNSPPNSVPFLEYPLASHQELSAFLAEVERRAFKQAMFAVRDEHAAHDVVQDAMLKLTEKYSDKPAEELPMLFQRIVQNTIHDHFRRQKVRSTWTTLLSALGRKDEKDDDFDPLETLAAKSDSNATVDPATQFEQAQIMGVIEQALTRLPARQREAFLLRYW